MGPTGSWVQLGHGSNRIVCPTESQVQQNHGSNRINGLKGSWVQQDHYPKHIKHQECIRTKHGTVLKLNSEFWSEPFRPETAGPVRSWGVNQKTCGQVDKNTCGQVQMSHRITERIFFNFIFSGFFFGGGGCLFLTCLPVIRCHHRQVINSPV